MNTLHASKLIVLVLPFALVAGGCNKGSSGGKPGARPNPKLEAIRAAGFPVTLAEYGAWYAEPPAEENAAAIYQQAFDALAPDDPSSASFVANNPKALALLHQAAGRQKCRYPIDLKGGFSTLLPHLAKIKKCAQLLSQEAKSHASKGQMDLASQSILDGLRLARSLEEEPILISHLVQVASETIMQAGLEAVLNGKSFSNEQLTRLQTAFADAESGVALTRSLVGERCSGLSAFEFSPQEWAKVMAAQDSARSFDLDAYRKTPAFKTDFDFFLDRMEECITASTSPFPQSLEGIGPWTSQVDEAKTKGHLISALLLPALASVLERAAEGVARLRVTQAALAVERYRAAHQNALPDSLSQLTPQFVRTVPTDPFDGQSLHYQKSFSTGYVVYSVGKDRKDDGGKGRASGSPSGASFDLSFAVRR